METDRLTRSVRALESHWQVRLPEGFAQVYGIFDHPFINPCDFVALDSLLADEERWRGMLPQFLPFGDDGDENYFGFYVGASAVGSDFPVLMWDHEYDHYFPVASNFDSFLRWCMVYSRYVAQDSFEELGDEDGEQRLQAAERLGLPRDLVTEVAPRNERELNERIARADGQNAWAISHLGSHYFRQGQVERARDFFVRASEAAPWFADPYYLLAETYRLSGEGARACRLWWRVFESPIAFSTRTSNYNLVETEPEAEVYEAAATRCIECRSELDGDAATSPLWRLLQEGDPFSSGPRFLLADELRVMGDGAGRERELLNALTLATDSRDISRAYEELIELYNRIGRHRDAALCRRDAALD